MSKAKSIVLVLCVLAIGWMMLSLNTSVVHSSPLMGITLTPTSKPEQPTITPTVKVPDITVTPQIPTVPAPNNTPQSPELIPVTGADMAGEALRSVFQVGLVALGLGLTALGLKGKRK